MKLNHQHLDLQNYCKKIYNHSFKIVKGLVNGFGKL
jgi:hypothetical protein